MVVPVDTCQLKSDIIRAVKIMELEPYKIALSIL